MNEMFKKYKIFHSKDKGIINYAGEIYGFYFFKTEESGCLILDECDINKLKPAYEFYDE